MDTIILSEFTYDTNMLIKNDVWNLFTPLDDEVGRVIYDVTQSLNQTRNLPGIITEHFRLSQ